MAEQYSQLGVSQDRDAAQVREKKTRPKKYRARVREALRRDRVPIRELIGPATHDRVSVFQDRNFQ